MLGEKIKVSEIFYSIQGEGRYMGVPSVFLRTFGCNFTCSGFGMPKGEKSNERDSVASNIGKYKKYKDLPLVNTGCDSYASWDPRFKHLSPVLTTEKIAEAIVETLPFKTWKEEHLVITGGEPLLGWQKSYPSLLEHVLMQNLKEITFETNGTQELSEDLKKYLHFWAMNPKFHRTYHSLTFSVSPKLNASGEKYEDAVKPEIIEDYQLKGYTYLKFVVSNDSEVEQVLDAVNDYRKSRFKGPVYLMPVGGVEHVYSSNNRKIAELAMKYGLRYSDRLQVPLFKNAWGT